jgi:primosomal replication protein N
MEADSLAEVVDNPVEVAGNQMEHMQTDLQQGHMVTASGMERGHHQREHMARWIE